MRKKSQPKKHVPSTSSNAPSSSSNEPSTSAKPAESKEEMMGEEDEFGDGEKTKSMKSVMASEESESDEEEDPIFGKEKFAIEKADFAGAILEVLEDLGKDQKIDFDQEAKNALQTAAENFMANIFRVAEISANAQKRLVVKKQDIELAKKKYLDEFEKIKKANEKKGW